MSDLSHGAKANSAHLTLAQKRALTFINTYAKNRRKAAQKNIEDILALSNIPQARFEKAIAKLKQDARVALHFHPDRPDPNNKPVAQALLEQGIYKSQFETHLSSGSVSAYPGGARDLWEEKLFGRAYQMDGVSNADRPKYGSLEIFQYPDGPSPRFGSCYFLLNPAVSHRCTFTYMDSHMDPPQKGTYEAFEDILTILFENAFHDEYALGRRNLSAVKLIDYLLKEVDEDFSARFEKPMSRNLNHYIEAQIHGPIDLKRDVDILVVDPSFAKSEIGDMLRQISIKYDIRFYLHPGFSLAVEEVPDNFRGAKMPALAKRIATDKNLSTYCIGKAAMDLKQNPSKWSDRGTYDQVLQELKLLWHVLVRFGKTYPK